MAASRDAVAHYRQAYEVLPQALEEESRGQFPRALHLYTEGIGHLLAGLRAHKNPATRGTVQQKAHEFMVRAEFVKAKLVTPSTRNDVSATPTEERKLSDEQKRLRRTLEDAILMEKPTVKWEDVVGLGGAKKALEEATVLPRRFPQLFTGKRKPWKGVLLFGPPGTGKSFLAKALANLNDCTFFSISSSDLVSKWLGESEKLVRELFALAKERKPSIIFIDEIDSICGSRERCSGSSTHEATRRIMTEFLTRMQDVLDTEGVVVLGATNRPYDLDPAVRRRFEKRVYIPLPSTEQREELFRVHIGKEPTDLTSADFVRLGACTEGYSGSDIATVVHDAMMNPVRTAVQATAFKTVGDRGMWLPCDPTDPRACRLSLGDIPADLLTLPPTTMADFTKALERVKPTVFRSEIGESERFNLEFGSRSPEAKELKKQIRVSSVGVESIPAAAEDAPGPSQPLERTQKDNKPREKDQDDDDMPHVPTMKPTAPGRRRPRKKATAV